MPIAAVLAMLLATGFHSPYCDTHRPAKSSGIRGVNFCNFSYPGAKPIGDPEQDLPLTFPSKFVLEHGVRPPDEEASGGLIILDNIQYARITSARHEDAIVTIFWFSGGTMNRGMVYVWSYADGKPTLRWSFVAGDRGFGGLHKAYASDGDLVVEINDPDAAMGNCCSRRSIRTRYRWDGKAFVPRGKPESVPNPEYAGVED